MAELRRRTSGERAAYLAGFEAGAEAALNEVARLNFSEVAGRAQAQVTVTLQMLLMVEDDLGSPVEGVPHG